MHKKFLFTFVTLSLLAPVSVYALSSEVHVTKDGKAEISSAKVMQQAGNTFFARLYWGDAFVRFTIKTDSSTKFLRATGEATTISEIKDGDLLDISGELQSQSDTLTINASSIKNSSVQKEQVALAGTVTAINPSISEFTLKDKKRGFVTIKTATSTSFIKGNRSLDLDHIHVGDRIIKAAGDYDIPSRTLSANSVITYIDPALYKPRPFTGKFIEMSPSTDNAFIKITVSEIPFTVFMSSTTTIMRNNKSTTTLQRFIKGDTIRIYGTRREIDEPVIDAEVVRNINL